MVRSDSGRDDASGAVRDLPGQPAVWLGLIAGTLGLTAVAAGDGVLPGDVAVTRAVQAVDPPGASVLVGAVNTIGGTLGVCLVTALVVTQCVRRRQAAAIVVVLVAVALRFGNALIKIPVESPRPTPNLVQVGEEAQGYGFPSAHVMGVVLLYGAFWVLAPAIVPHRAGRWLLRAVAAVMVLTIGYGRIAVGAHWPSDVLGAYLFGVLGLVGLLVLGRAHQDGRLAAVGDRLAAFAVAIDAACVDRIAVAIGALPALPGPLRRPIAAVVPVRTRAGRSATDPRRSR